MAVAELFRIPSMCEEVVEMADVTMPMNGKVIAVNVQVGQSVEEDDELIIIEAMKMELPIVSTSGGTVKEVKAKVGDSYQVGDVLVVVE
jgi:acetyl-CoA carboxylase biotin carboxyl carrier protein